MYQKMRESTFGKRLGLSLDELKDLPEFERLCLDRVYNNMLINSFNLFGYKLRNKFQKNSTNS